MFTLKTLEILARQSYNLFSNCDTLIRKPNLYLGFLSTKRANPIRLVMNLGGPINLTESLVKTR